MKSLSLLTLLLANFIALALCDGSKSYEITYYGDEDDGDAAARPSCGGSFSHKLPKYFAALSTKLSNYNSYCGHYAVFMMANGSNKNLGIATVVDSCSSCAKYHLDLSLPAFQNVAKKKDGEGDAIWGIYTKSGKKLAGPYYEDVSGAAKKFGLSSSDAFVAAFDANAQKLAASGNSSASFSASGINVEKSSSSTTSSTSTTTSTATATINSTETLPLATGTTGITATNVANVTDTTTNIAATPEAVPPQHEGQKVHEVEIAISERSREESDGMGATIGILAIGGGVIGAAGAGLLFMKKKNPNSYDELKQKFPEAFTNVKRGLTRRATSIKRAVTKTPKTSEAVAAV